jgi:hypothetical protein
MEIKTKTYLFIIAMYIYIAVIGYMANDNSLKWIGLVGTIICSLLIFKSKRNEKYN